MTDFLPKVSSPFIVVENTDFGQVSGFQKQSFRLSFYLNAAGVSAMWRP